MAIEEENIIFDKLTNIFNIANKINKNTVCKKEYDIEKNPAYCWVCWDKINCPLYLSNLIIREIKNDWATTQTKSRSPRLLC